MCVCCCSFCDPQHRYSRPSAVLWLPTQPTQLLLTYDDDRKPAPQVRVCCCLFCLCFLHLCFFCLFCLCRLRISRGQLQEHILQRGCRRLNLKSLHLFQELSRFLTGLPASVNLKLHHIRILHIMPQVFRGIAGHQLSMGNNHHMITDACDLRKNM